MRYLTITIAGETYKSSMDDLVGLDIREAQAIKANTGMSMMTWLSALTDFDNPHVIASIMYLLMSRAGAIKEWSEIGHLKLMDIVSGLTVVDEPEPTPDSVDVPLPDITPKELAVNGAAATPAKKTKTAS